MNKLFAICSLILFNSLCFADTFVLFPEDKTKDFRNQVESSIISYFELSKERGISENIVFINGSNFTEICKVAVNSSEDARRGLKKMFYKKKCRKNRLKVNLLKFNKAQQNTKTNSTNYVDIPNALNFLTRNYELQEADTVIIYTHVQYINDKATSIDFHKGVTTLGHISEESNGISPFSISGVAKPTAKVKLHILTPQGYDKNYVDLEPEGILPHKSDVSVFWLTYLSKRNFELLSYREIQKGFALIPLNVEPTKEFKQSENVIAFKNYEEIKSNRKQAAMLRTQQAIEAEERAKYEKELRRQQEALARQREERKILEAQHKEQKRLLELKRKEAQRQQQDQTLQNELKALEQKQKEMQRKVDEERRIAEEKAEELKKAREARKKQQAMYEQSKKTLELTNNERSTPYGNTKSIYEYEIKPPMILKELTLTEFDGDNDGNLFVKTFIHDENGNVKELFTFQPSGNNEEKTHKATAPQDIIITRLLIYPVDQNGKYNELGGMWQIRKLQITGIVH